MSPGLPASSERVVRGCRGSQPRCVYPSSYRRLAADKASRRVTPRRLLAYDAHVVRDEDAVAEADRLPPGHEARSQTRHLPSGKKRAGCSSVSHMPDCPMSQVQHKQLSNGDDDGINSGSDALRITP